MDICVYISGAKRMGLSCRRYAHASMCMTLAGTAMAVVHGHSITART